MPKIFLWLLLFSGIAADAAEVNITGVSALPGYPVRVIAYDDLISGWQTSLTATTADFKGSFSLRFNVPQPGWVIIAAAQYRTELFVAPGGSYTIQLEMKKNIGTAFYDPHPLTIKILDAHDNGLTEAISSVNVAFNAFLVENFNALYRLQQTRLLDSLKTMVRKNEPKISNHFFNEYTFYKLASIEPVVRKLGPNQVYDRFFRGRPVLYYQPEYVALLRETFKHHLLQSRLWSEKEYAEALSKGWKAFEKLLMRDAILAESRPFRELFVLMHLADNFHHPLHRQIDLERLLKGLSSTTQVPDYARIANNIIRKALWLQPGTKAPVFSLNNETGHMLTVDEHSPATLFVIVGPECSSCEYELLQLREIHGKMGGQYSFVTISMPESFHYYRNFHRRNKLDWPVYNLGHQYQLLDALDHRVMPHLVLYLPGAKVGMIPAPSSDQRLENHLQRLAKQLTKP